MDIEFRPVAVPLDSIYRIAPQKVWLRKDHMEAARQAEQVERPLMPVNFSPLMAPDANPGKWAMQMMCDIKANGGCNPWRLLRDIPGGLAGLGLPSDVREVTVLQQDGTIMNWSLPLECGTDNPPVAWRPVNSRNAGGKPISALAIKPGIMGGPYPVDAPVPRFAIGDIVVCVNASEPRYVVEAMKRRGSRLHWSVQMRAITVDGRIVGGLAEVGEENLNATGERFSYSDAVTAERQYNLRVRGPLYGPGTAVRVAQGDWKGATVFVAHASFVAGGWVYDVRCRMGERRYGDSGLEPITQTREQTVAAWAGTLKRIEPVLEDVRWLFGIGQKVRVKDDHPSPSVRGYTGRVVKRSMGATEQNYLVLAHENEPGWYLGAGDLEAVPEVEPDYSDPNKLMLDRDELGVMLSVRPRPVPAPDSSLTCETFAGFNRRMIDESVYKDRHRIDFDAGKLVVWQADYAAWCR